ncbi:Hsp20/alpha crystallin family protein [Treponema berlinense]|uniref:Hsp20/alpha crystallin family protein n=1 Tax=Treponema berlinense TaxID=225004 RepID=UPI003FD8C369
MNDLALFNDLFNDFGDDGYTMPAFSYKKMFHMPKVDVKESKENYTLTMDMPGKTDKDVDIELNQNVLTVSSKDEVKKEEKSDKKDETKWLIRERTVSSFKRSFTLPDDVDSEKLTANVKDGVLTVSMPRKALAQPKHIAITSA